MRVTRSVSAFMCAAMFLFSGTGCQRLALEEKEDQTMEETVSIAATQGKEDRIEDFYGVDLPQISFEDSAPSKLTAQQVADFPIASSEMSAQERRKLCVEFFELQLSFLWETDFAVTDYPTTYEYKAEPKTLDQGTVYSGIPYQSTGTGNVYRWLEYYDEATGKMDLERAFAENGGYGDGAVVSDVETDENGNVTHQKYRSFRILFNQCSVSSFWGWARVVNSADFGSTSDMNVNGGFIPVGLYTYPNMETLTRFGVKNSGNPTGYDTEDVIANVIREKGNNGIANCYALMRAGDCLVSGGHAMMVKSVDPQRSEDGEIIRTRSTVVVLEQIESWAKVSETDGKPFRQQGGVNRVYTFDQLQEKGYIPFTFAELLDESDPLDRLHLEFYRKHIQPRDPLAAYYGKIGKSAEEVAAMSGEGVEKAVLFSDLDGKSSVTLQELQQGSIGSNYPISDIFLTVRDQNGMVLLQNIHRTLTAHERVVSMSAPLCSGATDAAGKTLPITYGLEKFADGKNLIEVQVQLSTGERLTAFSVSLNP